MFARFNIPEGEDAQASPNHRPSPRNASGKAWCEKREIYFASAQSREPGYTAHIPRLTWVQGNMEEEVTDLSHIELDRLLRCAVDELIALVQPMSADICERYARAILGRIDGPSFEQLMMRIVETAWKDRGRPPFNSDAYYLAARKLFPHIPREDNVVGRLVFLIVHTATLRLEGHPNLSTH
jgi:hypothetical protein